MEKLAMEILEGRVINITNRTKNDITLKTSRNEKGEIDVEILDNTDTSKQYENNEKGIRIITANTRRRIEF